MKYRPRRKACPWLGRITPLTTSDQLLINKLPGAIAPEKRTRYIKNLLRDMAREGTIETDGARTKAAKWRLKPGSGLGQDMKWPNG